MTWPLVALTVIFIASTVPLYGPLPVALGTLFLLAVCGLWIWMES